MVCDEGWTYVDIGQEWQGGEKKQLENQHWTDSCDYSGLKSIKHFGENWKFYEVTLQIKMSSWPSSF